MQYTFRLMGYPVRFIIVSGGRDSAAWYRFTLPKVMQTNKAAPVAAVDSDPEMLKVAQECLGLAAEHCYTDAGEAFDKRTADFALILSPSPGRQKLVDLAMVYDLHVLIDTPIADTMAAACRIYKSVRDADKKMAVVTTHRFDQDKQTLMRLVASKQYGRLNYIVARSTHNFRKRGSWGGLRHQMTDPLLIEDGVQSFDLFRALAESEAKTVRAISWNPPWGDFRGDSTAIVTVEMENGVHCLYEGAAANACTMNGWGNEYVRVECEYGTLELDHRKLRLLKGEALEEPKVADLPLADQPLWGDAWLTEMFCDYINDRIKPVNRLRESFKSIATTFAAVESARTGKPVEVQPYLKEQFHAV